MPRAFRDDERARIRRRLLDAGRAAMAAGGLRRVPVERLCAAAGISKGAFYLFFETKEALVVELLREVEATLRAELERVAERPPEERLRAVLTVLFTAADTHPLLRVLGDPEELAWLVRALPEGHFEAARADDDAFFGALWGRLRAEGLVREADPRVIAGLGAAALALAQQRALVGEDRYEAVVALLVEGLVLRLQNGGSPRPEAGAP